MATSEVPVVKDFEAEQPVPTIWRAELRRLADAIAEISEADELFSAADLSRYRKAIASYPTVLGSLPDETWRTSVALWLGEHWEVLVDLFDQAGGRTDLVMQTKVMESSGRYQFAVQLVYVP